MKTLAARFFLVVLVILATPVSSLAGGEASGDVWWEWFVRLITWASGGWHGF
jgi:hypothetical protein